MFIPYLMEKICKITGKKFVISDRDLEFYKNLGVQIPTVCPNERTRRRMAIRNERNLYKRKSDFSGVEMISMYHQDSPYKVYTKEEWLSDKWEAMDYGQNIVFDKPFFKQFADLQKAVPRANLAIFANTENSDFCNYVGDAKNCYLCFGSIFIEDCMYGNPYYSKDCLDCFLVRKSELCYECIDCEGLYYCAYLQECYDCKNCCFSYDLKGCNDCIGCTGLRNKSYYIFNKAYSREDYEKFAATFSFCNGDQVKMVEEKLEGLNLLHPHRAMISLNSENVSGNYIFNSKNCFDCFQISNNEGCNYNIQTVDNKDCFDMNYTEENELCYEYLGNYRNYKTVFSAICYGCSDVWYSDYCTNCKNCFGCSGLKNKEFCILNKQYSKDEYLEMRDRLIGMMKINGEWGEFFPVDISPFAYNESIAQDYFPLKEAEALERGYRWREEDKADFKSSSFVPPVNIEEVSESICEETLSCESSGRNFRIMPAELKFYKRMGLPIPRKHFIERHKARLGKRLLYEVFERSCDSCGGRINTSYGPDRVEKIYCEECYLKTVY